MTARSASCDRQGFRHLVSALIACGTAALLCPSISVTLGASGGAAATFQQVERTTTIAPLSCKWQIDGITFTSNASATAALPKTELSRLPFSLRSITANDLPSSRNRVQRHDGRGPPALCAVNARAGGDRDDHDHDQGLDASRASLPAEAWTSTCCSTTCRLLQRSARRHSVRGPPQ